MITTTKLYKGAVSLLFDDVKHLYTVDGVPVNGVTTVLGVINKPALVYWSANKAAEYVDLYLPVGSVVDEISKKELVAGCKTAHRKLLSSAGDFGTILHGLIEKLIKGEPYVEPVHPKLKEAIGQFLKWVKDNDVKFNGSERKIYSKKYNYAGTLDFLATINGKKVLGDLKTSSGVYDEMSLQLAAYQNAMQEEFGVGIDRSVIIRCGKDGSFEVAEITEFEKNFEAFICALGLHRRLKEMSFKKLKENLKKSDVE